MKTAIIFFFAVLSEVIATSALKFSEGFTKLIPSIIVILGYGTSFYLLSLSLKVIPIGTAYALWSGIGIVLTVIAGIVLWRETMDWARGIGILLIMLGILTINLFSKSVTP
jgi:small multidrug resistance pump